MRELFRYHGLQNCCLYPVQRPAQNVVKFESYIMHVVSHYSIARVYVDTYKHLQS